MQALSSSPDVAAAAVALRRSHPQAPALDVILRRYAGSLLAGGGAPEGKVRSVRPPYVDQLFG